VQVHVHRSRWLGGANRGRLASWGCMGDSTASEERDPLSAAIERARAAERAFGSFVARLRDADASFAEASVLHPEDMGEWQAATFLLMGSWVVWGKLGAAVMESRSAGPVIEELEGPTHGWSGCEREVLIWTAHFWDLDRYPAHFLYRFDKFYSHRWIVACQLRKGLAPVDLALLQSNR
jgi:hypothetical protein